MRKLFIFFPFLIATGVSAMSQKPAVLSTCKGVDWKDPTEFEDGQPLNAKDIDYIVLYSDGKIYKQDGQSVTKYKAGTERARWFILPWKKCPKCVRGQTVLKNNNKSKIGVCL